MNDSDRAEWINNDEGLYRWWKSERKPLRVFIRENRDELTRLIEAVTSGKVSAHALAYAPWTVGR